MGSIAISGDRHAGDMLVRYSANADGAIVEAIGCSLSKWAEKILSF
jgi:hypothetical protein